MNSNYAVAAAFVRHEAAHSANLTSTLDSLYSYSTKIAEWTVTNGIRVSTEGYSNTTKRQLSDLRRALLAAGYRATDELVCLRPGGWAGGEVAFLVWRRPEDQAAWAAREEQTA